MTNYWWSETPGSNVWNDANNWSPSGPPGPADTATFASSSQTQITFAPTGGAQVGDIVFATDAFPYTFQLGPSSAPGLVIQGGGVNNQSQQTQSFTVAATSTGIENPQLVFAGSSSAGGSNNSYTAGPVSPDGAGGGVIAFVDSANAGSASFTAWTGSTAPVEPSTVGGEISFSNNASASTATFNTWGTTGQDGDTFGTVGFHDTSTAATAKFINNGGTIANGDGGNTQFYDNSTAASALFENIGGTVNEANGGDVAFDGTSTGANGTFNNYAATAKGGHGGVTSFNNNPPQVSEGGASAGNGIYNNYGAQSSGQGGGGHTEFTGKYGSPTAFSAQINNYGGQAQGASGGYTSFSNTSSAGSATILATGGASGGYAATIYFDGASTAGEATIRILGGELALSSHTGALVIGALEWNGGTVGIQLGTTTTTLTIWSNLILEAAGAFTFTTGAGFASGASYPVLSAPNLSQYSAAQFSGNPIGNVNPVFSISGTTLFVTYPG